MIASPTLEHPALSKSDSAPYGYEPIAFTTSPPGVDLQNAAVFCKVKSWLTWGRLASVPFSDHCGPLVDAPRDLSFIVTSLEKKLCHDHLRYIETRPTRSRDLLSLTRRRHVVLSQPKRWFRTLIDCFGKALTKFTPLRRCSRSIVRRCCTR
jgi:hypothetical protein